MCAKEESFQVERAIDYILFNGIKFVEMYFLLFNDFNLYFFLSPNFSGCLKKCLFHCQIVVLFYSEKGFYLFLV